MSPWPGAFTTFDGGQRLKVLKAHLHGDPTGVPTDRKPGEILRRAPHIHLVETGDGVMMLDLVQPEGGRPITGTEFAQGRGARLERFDAEASP